MKTTLAPAVANIRTVAAPMPREPPEISATLPERDRGTDMDSSLRLVHVQRKWAGKNQEPEFSQRHERGAPNANRAPGLSLPNSMRCGARLLARAKARGPACRQSGCRSCGRVHRGPGQECGRRNKTVL